MSEYVLGSSDTEIERLAYQNEVWSNETTALWARAGIGLGHRVADFGCGPGFCTKALARLVGSGGHVHAVDASDRFTRIVSGETVGASNITVHRSDVYSTPIQEGSVDAVFARWLFCFLKEPGKGIEEVTRILKPGGKLVVFDYFNYLAADVYPKRHSAAALFEAFTEDLESTGGSWDTGGEITGLAFEAGMEIESLTPITRIGRPGSQVWNWVAYYIKVTVPRLVESGIWTQEQRLKFDESWKKAEADPASFVFAPPMIGIVARKT